MHNEVDALNALNRKRIQNKQGNNLSSVWKIINNWTQTFEMIYKQFSFFFIFIVGLPLVISLSGECKDKITGEWRCCTDYMYKNTSGTCEPCIGLFGLECTRLCSEGYYGHGCRSTCFCDRNEHCDRVYGCLHNAICRNNFTEKIELCGDDIENISNKNSPPSREEGSAESLQIYQFVLTAAGSISLTSAFWMVYFKCKWYRKQNLNKKKSRRAREKTPVSERGHFRNDTNESENVFQESQSPRDRNNGLFNRYSDNYNHIDFQNRSTHSSTPVTSSNYSKINLNASHQYENADIESHSEENSNVCNDVSEKLHLGSLNISQGRGNAMDKELHCSLEYERNMIYTQEQSFTDLQLCKMNDFHLNTRNNYMRKSVSPDFEDVDEVYGFNRKDVQSLSGLACKTPKTDRINSIG